MSEQTAGHPDLMASSADTWRDRRRDPPAIPEALRPPGHVRLGERLSALRRRHALRRQRAEEVYTASRSPERGWPVADQAAVLAFVRRLVGSRRRTFAMMVGFNALAAAAALFVPRLLGQMIDRTDASAADTRAAVLVLLAVVAGQALFTFLGQRTSTVFGQDLLSSAREYIIRTILGLPLGRVESASTGDLVTRVTRDVGTMSRSVQYGLPMAIISVLTVSLSVVAMLVNSVVLAVPSLLLIGSSAVQVRRYLQRAQKCYIAEGATYSRINTTLTETVEGARTVEALGLGEQRLAMAQADVEVSAQAERYGMTLRNLLFAVIDVAFNTPRVLTVLVGAWGYARGWVTLGQITAAVL
ncbi:MAG: ABC transporter ATP-binding protein, partial [Nocardioides sp.]